MEFLNLSQSNRCSDLINLVITWWSGRQAAKTLINSLSWGINHLESAIRPWLGSYSLNQCCGRLPQWSFRRLPKHRRLQVWASPLEEYSEITLWPLAQTSLRPADVRWYRRSRHSRRNSVNSWMRWLMRRIIRSPSLWRTTDQYRSSEEPARPPSLVRISHTEPKVSLI